MPPCQSGAYMTGGPETLFFLNWNSAEEERDKIYTAFAQYRLCRLKTIYKVGLYCMLPYAALPKHWKTSGQRERHCSNYQTCLKTQVNLVSIIVLRQSTGSLLERKNIICFGYFLFFFDNLISDLIAEPQKLIPKLIYCGSGSSGMIPSLTFMLFTLKQLQVGLRTLLVGCSEPANSFLYFV